MSAKEPQAPQERLTTEEFIEKSGVANLLNQLKSEITQRKGGELVVSDVLDDHGNQYVDLVQEGGGVWGISLVGYTYVMEEMGIRFFSLAGTSAGAINAMMLAVSGNANEKKSSHLLDHLLNLELDKIVDGAGEENRKTTAFIRWVIKAIIRKPYFFQSMMSLTHWLLMLFITLTAASFIGNFLILHPFSSRLGLPPLILMIGIFGILMFLKSYLKDILSKGLGLNEGKYFHYWIKNAVQSNHIYGNPDKPRIANMETFNEHFSKPLDLTIRKSRQETAIPPQGNERMITIVTCDITSQCKIELPLMWDLYWDKIADIHPGDLVRASMSIPGFFKMFKVNINHPQSKLDIWKQRLLWKNDIVPGEVNFVDGGAISNFPLNVFSSILNPVPRMPTFGVKLYEGEQIDDIAKAETILQYANSLVATIRGYYDKDFLIRNPSFRHGVTYVNLTGYSSINFFMEEDEKMQLFLHGALAAANFLKSFNWTEYKIEREKDVLKINKLANPNNLLREEEKVEAIAQKSREVYSKLNLR